MVPIKPQIANKNNYGTKRSISNIKYIVVHYTGNDGDSDESNGKYFKNHIVKASAHYFVDDDSITQAVPDDYSAYAVGGKKWNNAGGRLHGTVNNSNSISVELCDTNRNGTVYPTAATINNALDLVRHLMIKYNVPLHRVIRHYDVNGKTCPAYWVDNSKWEAEFLNKLGACNREPSGPDINPYKEPEKQITSKSNAQKLGISVFESSGDGVKWVQWELCQVSPSYREAIVLNGGIDGKCGPNTVALIKLFQSAYGLEVDGVCGRNTRKALKAN